MRFIVANVAVIYVKRQPQPGHTARIVAGGPG